MCVCVCVCVCERERERERVFMMLKYFCVKIKVGFMKNNIRRNSIMKLCSILNSLGKSFETLYVMHL